jgi:hypothetical protein
MLIRFFLFFCLLTILSCRDRIPIKQVNKKTSKKEVKCITPSLNIYVEDGVSMHGFFEKGSNFTTDISKLFSNFPKVNKTEFNLISGKESSIKSILIDKFNLIDKIDNINLEKRNIEGTDYPKMLDKVISASNENTVSVFVSDFIHASGLSNENAETQIFQILKDKKSKSKKFTVAVFKLSSFFDGPFSYVSDYNNIVKGPKRIKEFKPYYLWFFGNSDAIEQLDINHTSIRSMNLKGFEDFSIYNEKKYDDIDNPINWTILQFTNSIGTFKPARNGETIEGVHDIENVKPDRETNQFQICIGIDLSKIPVSDEYKLDTNNYKIESNGFKIEQICKLNGDNYDFNGKAKIDSKDLNLLSKVKPTHLLFLKSNEKIVDNLEISLRRNISPILLQSNSDDESNLKNLKTYGFRNFTEAIKKSFPHYNENSFYFTKKISVENKKGGFSWIMVLLVIGFIGVIIIIVIKNKK